MARDPSPDLVLTLIQGKSRTVEQLLTTFHLLFVAIDPFTNQSAWILPTAGRILQTFEQADCRIAWLVTATPEECRQFLGPWANQMMTFADPERVAVKEFGLERLPALVHLGMQGKVEGAAEGWHPQEWKAITDRLAKTLSWQGPNFPTPRDPGPFEGSAALG
ncbi:MAG TPA: hypothetical protein VHT75_08850 [Acidimicrobiales bacterium]|nr:hypothetical protein [Acidimicrobiales bacterium]